MEETESEEVNKARFYFLIGLIFIVLCGGAWFIVRDLKEAQNTETPNSTTTEDGGRYMDIESYVRYDISNLSPIKESLGGTFYVTSLETHDGTGVVSYEDGHNAYTADFTYEISGIGQPLVRNFVIRTTPLKP